MVDSTSPVTGASGSEQVSESAGAGAPTGQAGSFSASTPVSNMADLREKAPDVYRAMMEGVAYKIVNDMKGHQERLKEMMREAQRDAQGG